MKIKIKIEEKMMSYEKEQIVDELCETVEEMANDFGGEFDRNEVTSEVNTFIESLKTRVGRRCPGMSIIYNEDDGTYDIETDDNTMVFYGKQIHEVYGVLRPVVSLVKAAYGMGKSIGTTLSTMMEKFNNKIYPNDRPCRIGYAVNDVPSLGILTIVLFYDDGYNRDILTYEEYGSDVTAGLHAIDSAFAKEALRRVAVNPDDPAITWIDSDVPYSQSMILTRADGYCRQILAKLTHRVTLKNFVVSDDTVTMACQAFVFPSGRHVVLRSVELINSTLFDFMFINSILNGESWDDASVVEGDQSWTLDAADAWLDSWDEFVTTQASKLDTKEDPAEKSVDMKLVKEKLKKKHEDGEEELTKRIVALVKSGYWVNEDIREALRKEDAEADEEEDE